MTFAFEPVAEEKSILPATAVEGKRHTSAEMNKLKLPKGKWWENVAPLGSKPAWVVKDAPQRRN